MISLKKLLAESTNDLKWIIGYVDGYDKVHYKVVKSSDPIDSHNSVWPGPRALKWRWVPTEPNKINTYGVDFDFEAQDRIWLIIDKFK